uniref:Ycf66 n=1 Tax=Mesotaenium endlicherianum TaxID=184485 RepID=A0A024B581_9VIRI|nr:hypothetical protein RF66 [Mesotaenium endlicherianum]AHZ11238.1 hypothetical protein RF66 [Mesotaenium endlicherianum]
MIHMEFGPSTVLGLALSMVGLLLFFLRTKRPEMSRDYDLFFSSMGLLSGGILMFQGWRLDPILLLGQVLSSVTLLFLWEKVFAFGMARVNLKISPCLMVSQSDGLQIHLYLVNRS